MDEKELFVPENHGYRVGRITAGNFVTIVVCFLSSTCYTACTMQVLRHYCHQEQWWYK